MLRQSIFLIFILSTTLFSCNKFQKTKGGLEYKIVDDKEGKNASVGDMMVLNVKYANEQDSLDTFAKGEPINAMLDSTIMYPGSIEEGLVLLSIGDSAIFKVKNKVLYKDTFKQEIPKKLDPEGTTTFYIKVDTIYSKDFIKQQQKQMLEQQMTMVNAYKVDLLDSAWVKTQLTADEIIIKNYINQKGIKASRTANGVYVAVLDSGKGSAVMSGDKLTVEYIGKFTSDKVFQDSKLTEERAGEFYAVHSERPFYNDLKKSMSSGHIVAMILEKDNAIADFRKLIGATDPAKAEEGTIRKIYATSMEANAVHGSDSDENAAIEGSFFFSGLEKF